MSDLQSKRKEFVSGLTSLLVEKILVAKIYKCTDLETHIRSDKCSFTQETQLTSDMCFTTWETNITSSPIQDTVIPLSMLTLI